MSIREMNSHETTVLVGLYDGQGLLKVCMTVQENKFESDERKIIFSNGISAVCNTSLKGFELDFQTEKLRKLATGEYISSFKKNSRQDSIW